MHSLEKEMATHSSVPAWRIPGMGLHRIGHNWSDLAIDAKDKKASRKYLLHLKIWRGNHNETGGGVEMLCSQEPFTWVGDPEMGDMLHFRMLLSKEQEV